jgi:hypothetical protein
MNADTPISLGLSKQHNSILTDETLNVTLNSHVTRASATLMVKIIVSSRTT